jgi:hypothetical protein
MTKKILTAFMILTSINLNAQTIESELNKISGHFVGEWTSYKYSPNGEIIKSMSWSDTLLTENPVINDSIAYVNVKSTMTFNNPNIPPYKMEFQEGFDLLNGKAINRFFIVMGVKSIESKVSGNTYIISQPINSYELNQLGFLSALEAYHTIVKLTLNIDGKEVHKVTRISTIAWENNSKIETVQFVSLEGSHERIE